MTASTHIRFPDVPARLGLGVGMDLPWGQRIGFQRDAAHGDTVTEKVRNFLARHQSLFSYMFVAFQPKNRDWLRAEDYFRAYDTLFGAAPEIHHRALHHTVLNMATLERFDPAPVVTFTNALIERYRFSWVVEDLGLWSLHGKPLPYPLPPFLTEEGLRACIGNVRRWQESLDVPLCVEFPGFTEGATFCIGAMDAFDFFREVARETRSPVTIDIGHILSYQWLRGRTGERKTEELERLPLEHCFEFHLSGCQISGTKFRDLHHGILLDEQIELCEYLLPRCPNLRAITYEDPQYADDGMLVPKSTANFRRLRDVAAAWASAGDA